MNLRIETPQHLDSARSRLSRKWAAIGIPEVMLLMVAAIWGASYSITKLATHQLPVLDFLALRFGLTFLVLLPALRPLFGGQWRRGVAVGGVLGGILLAIFMCETFGVTLTTASNAAFLISLCVGFTPLVEWMLFRRRPSGQVLGAVVTSVLGAALLTLTSTTKLSVGWGDGLIIVAAFLRAVMVCTTRWLAGHHALPALTLTAIQSGVVAVGTLLISFVMPLTRWGNATSAPWGRLAGDVDFWLEMGFLVLFCTVFAFFAQNFAASRSSPTRVSLLMGSEPVFGALFAILWLNESISALGWAGGALIVGSAWWASSMPTKENSKDLMSSAPHLPCCSSGPADA
ncbi:MAG: DMT family transporter [Acidiphilium sp.]|nr:DMT family transporter [Acidiphilium sp.]MDD4936447.1 DMT family transporter [Acidiphilium sp.]